MRIFLVVVLVLLFMAASVRIDGVWPPASIYHEAEQVARQAGSPGLIALALLRELVPEQQGTSRIPKAPRAPSTARFVADSHPDVAPSRRECG